MPSLTVHELVTLANAISTETNEVGNTKEKIGGLFQSLAESAITSAQNATALRAILAAGTNANVINLRYHTASGDGGGGMFNVTAIGSYVDNGGTIFTGGTLAAIRKIGATEPIDVAWFGAVMGWSAANATANRAALVRALEVANELPLGSIDDDEQGDNNYTVSRKLRPVTWHGVLVWGPGIVIRFQMAGLIPIKQTSYDAGMVCACTDDGGPMFTLYTGPKPAGWDSQAPVYPWYWKPAFAGPGVVFYSC